MPDISRLNPNGIELRLGEQIKFLSTGEEMEVPEGGFVKIAPGESAIIVSLETLDFSRKAVQKVFPDCMLMAWINPTTTMMREGILQVATKVDAGFIGQLNWGLRNSSYKDLLLQYGEPVFKLTLILLEGDEIPEQAYGERPGDRYQKTDGILSSARRIPTDIPKKKIITSGRDKIDPENNAQGGRAPV